MHLKFSFFFLLCALPCWKDWFRTTWVLTETWFCVVKRSGVNKLVHQCKTSVPLWTNFLSVFWIPSKSNQKYRLDVVSEIFNRSGRNKNIAERHQAFELIYSKTSMPLYMVPESFVCPGGSPNDQIRYRKHSMTDTEWMHSFSTYSQEPPVQRPPPLIARSNIIKRALYIYEALYSLMRKLNLTTSVQTHVVEEPCSLLSHPASCPSSKTSN